MKHIETKIEIYQSSTNNTEIRVQFEEETVWLTQKQLSEIFQTTPQNIAIHLKNIFEEGELDEKSTCKDFLHVQMEGKRTHSRRLLPLFYGAEQCLCIIPMELPLSATHRGRTGFGKAEHVAGRERFDYFFTNTLNLQTYTKRYDNPKRSNLNEHANGGTHGTGVSGL